MSEQNLTLNIAVDSLRANVLELPQGQYIAAGGNQFRTLWTRDFCHACRGFFALKEFQVIKDHLGRLLTSIREDGLVPRVLDNRVVQWRVAYQLARTVIPVMPAMPLGEPLIPQYTDEHGSEAIDSNLLVILTAIRLRDEAPDGKAWWLQHEAQLRRVWKWYEKHLKQGLIQQTAFSDWQDSVQRVGVTFLTNLFYFLAASRLQALGWESSVDTQALKARLKDTFYHFESGLFRSLTEGDYISLEGNLFCLEASEFLTAEEKIKLWQALLLHPLVSSNQGLIGRCTYPEWPKSLTVWHVKLVGLYGYHGALAWSWLVGFGLKVAREMGDKKSAALMYEHITRLLQRDGEVIEVYVPSKNWEPWRSWLYAAERPFSWGAGFIIEGLLQSEA